MTNLTKGQKEGKVLLVLKRAKCLKQDKNKYQKLVDKNQTSE